MGHRVGCDPRSRLVPEPARRGGRGRAGRRRPVPGSAGGARSAIARTAMWNDTILGPGARGRALCPQGRPDHPGRGPAPRLGFARDRPPGTTHRRRGRHLQPAAPPAAPGRAAGGGPGARRGAGGRQRLDRRHGRVARGAHRSRAGLLTENTGGAGGFHDGLAWAVERGADLVWLMDDDGLPDPDCLGRLLEHPDLDFWGPVVVDEDAPDRLVFPIRLPWWHPGRERDGRGPRGRHGRRDPRRRHPVQRRARDPRPGRADRAAARGVLHLGRRRRVPLAGQRRGRADRDGGGRGGAPPERG